MAKYTITDQEWENVISKVRELENENQKLTGVIKGMEKAIELLEIPQKDRDGNVFAGRYIAGIDPIENDYTYDHQMIVRKDRSK